MNDFIVIDAGEELAIDLQKDFEHGIIIVGPIDLGSLKLEEGEELRQAFEAQVDRIGKLKIEIFSNEHPPPHFRVIYDGETANYTIKDCIKLNGGLDPFRNNIKKWHGRNKQKLIDKWNDMRPSNCPVGRYVESN
ncbi:DUF4160 domain-containing protein [Methylophilus sp.]|uniref:DUF4160 domain-containing protein n=1 Tax=Methylophilus sp. TaxID=29541 RepID=UPI004036937E